MLGDLLRQDAGDEIAGYDEEDIDPDITAAENVPAGVKEQDRQDGHGAQTIYVGPVLHQLLS